MRHASAYGQVVSKKATVRERDCAESRVAPSRTHCQDRAAATAIGRLVLEGEVRCDKRRTRNQPTASERRSAASARAIRRVLSEAGAHPDSCGRAVETR